MEKKDTKYKPYLIFVSFFVNLLVLVPSVYMIQIYDRVMATQNIGTLISITTMVIIMLLFYSILEFCRKSFVEYMEEVYTNKFLKNPFHIHMFDNKENFFLKIQEIGNVIHFKFINTLNEVKYFIII